jgi:hypothetical protein
MTIDRLRELYDAAPFQPFVIELADGRQVPVYQRDFMMLAPSGRTVVVVQPDDSLSIINVDDSARISEMRANNIFETSRAGGFGHDRTPSKTVLAVTLALFVVAVAAMLPLLFMSLESRNLR